MRGSQLARLLFCASLGLGLAAVAAQQSTSCDDSCRRANNGRCDEPGFGTSCAAGTDCTDCGGRVVLEPPAGGSRTAPEPEPEPELVVGCAEPAPAPPTVLSQQTGLLVVVGFGAAFTLLTQFVTQLEAKRTGKTEMSSEQFNTGGRDVGIGLTAAVIVSQWTWAATLLQSR
jgi:hypothetical protein